MSIYLTSKVSCVKCRKEYGIKGIHTHFDRTHGDIETKNKYSSGNNGKYDQIKNNYQDRYEQNPSFCLECNKKLPFKQKHNKFCSHSCSAKSANRKRSELGWVPTFEQRKKVTANSALNGYIAIRSNDQKRYQKSVIFHKAGAKEEKLVGKLLQWIVARCAARKNLLKEKFAA